ncbi:hypothetical protein N7512_004937 [Penicillium capsulatum]|nr:hypothetical protein N7512_004937 [Penicillium capsulatum]
MESNPGFNPDFTLSGPLSSSKNSSTPSRVPPAKPPRGTPNTVSGFTGPAKRQPKRKGTHAQTIPSDATCIDLTADEPHRVTKKPKAQTRKERNELIIPEKRARKYRNYPPQSFLARLERISYQRMFVVGHQVGGSEEAPEISFDIVGSTGNLYRTIIGKEPSCDCPDGLKGNQCKHICYVLLHALKAPSHLQYQLAFLTSELREMYQGSPLIRVKSTSTENKDGKRKPIEGDCPVCYMEFQSHESTVWCKASCGNNVHKDCFEKWAATTRSSGVRCVYCRTIWEFDGFSCNVDSVRTNGDIGEDGYVNVADQFGLSRERGMSPSL